MFLAHIAFVLSGLRKGEPNQQWVIGVDEIAGNIGLVTQILETSISVCFNPNIYHQWRYDFKLPLSGKSIGKLLRILYGPILFGRLARNHDHFFYIWSTGFTLNREREFQFLKKRHKKIVCLFVGSDIRSPKMLSEYLRAKDLDSFSYYLSSTQLGYGSAEFEERKRQTADIADTYADIIFSAPHDQKSYLQSEQYAWPYVYPDERFQLNLSKFDRISIIRILHAPSNPIVKGTPLVRAAIKKLREEGYSFEYIELMGVKNNVILEALGRSHIVLNQFYAFLPGLFGIEALAHCCAVLMSADPTVERGILKSHPNNAWLLTRYWEIYDNLKYLLDNPDQLRGYAERGYEYASQHCTVSNARSVVKTLFMKKGIITSGSSAD